MTNTITIVEGFEITIMENVFPDGNFREYLKDTFDKDNRLSQDELYSIISIDVSNKDIKSLEGITRFANL